MVESRALLAVGWAPVVVIKRAADVTAAIVVELAAAWCVVLVSFVVGRVTVVDHTIFDRRVIAASCVENVKCRAVVGGQAVVRRVAVEGRVIVVEQIMVVGRETVVGHMTVVGGLAVVRQVTVVGSMAVVGRVIAVERERQVSHRRLREFLFPQEIRETPIERRKSVERRIPELRESHQWLTPPPTPLKMLDRLATSRHCCPHHRHQRPEPAQEMLDCLATSPHCCHHHRRHHPRPAPPPRRD